MHELIDQEISCHGCQHRFDCQFITVGVEKATNDLRGSDRVDSLDIHLDKLGEVVLVQVQNEVVDKIETITDRDQGGLILELRLLQKVLHFLRF
jgi:hypothetical protein